MLKRAPTAFGIAVKTRLLELGQTQEWLIAACRERTGMYVDSSTMYKLLTGQLNSYRLEAAVRDISEHSQSGPAKTRIRKPPSRRGRQGCRADCRLV